MTTLMQQRAEALLVMKSNLIVNHMVVDICFTGKQECRFIIDRLLELIKRQYKTACHFPDSSLVIYPHPTKEEWVTARDLSKLFKSGLSAVSRQLVAPMGRPKVNWSDVEQGGIYIFKPTGYVDPRTANHSALWFYSCDCGKGETEPHLVATAQEISRGKYCCDAECPKRAEFRAKFKAQRKRKAAPPTPDEASTIADAIMKKLH
jgi:hypothetical protein